MTRGGSGPMNWVARNAAPGRRTATPTPSASVTDLSAAAVSVLSRGLALFALPPDGRRPMPGWQQRCTSDPDLVRRWVETGHNVGVGCRASGVVGIDLDRPDGGPDGIATFTAVCTRHGQDWPDTLTTATPRRSLHLYFRVPSGRTICSTSGARSALGPGIDTRGPGRRSGGYLLGPGSLVGGIPYVIERDTSVTELPTWLADLLDRRDGRQRVTRDAPETI